MRDAVTFEARGIPTVILVNDVFAPIAHATAALLELPANYVAANVVWLPHPTSNLTAAAAAALVDERIDAIVRALTGGHPAADAPAIPRPASSPPNASAADLARARAAVDGLAGSLRADGAELVLTTLAGGVLAGELRTGDVTCADGACIMPAEALERMIEALVRPHVPDLRRVVLEER